MGLTESGRAAWQEEEKRKDFSNVLILQEQSCTSELFKVIQDAVLLILHYRAMSLFRTVSSSTLITPDVQSIYIPSSIQDWYREDKIWATDRQHFFCMWFLWIKNIRILTRSTWKHRVLHNTCTKHGRIIKIRCIGTISTLLWRKDWSSIKHDRTLSFFTKHSQLIVSRKLFGWKLEKSYTRRYMRHLGLLQRFPWNMTGWKIWVQKLLNDQREKLRNNPKVPNQANQIQTQFSLPSKRSVPLSGNRNTFFSWRSCEIREDGETCCLPWWKSRAPTVVCSEQASHPRFSREGQNLIFEDETNHDRTEKPVVCRDANHERSILNEVNIDFRIPGLPHSVVKQADNYRVRELVKKIENTLADKLFNEIYNKTKLTTHLVRIPRKW